MIVLRQEATLGPMNGTEDMTKCSRFVESSQKLTLTSDSTTTTIIEAETSDIDFQIAALIPICVRVSTVRIHNIFRNRPDVLWEISYIDLKRLI
jgi:hypothetical protein